MARPPLSPAYQPRVREVAVLLMRVMSVGGAGIVAGVAFVVVEFVLVPSMVVCATRNW